MSAEGRLYTRCLELTSKHCTALQSILAMQGRSAAVFSLMVACGVVQLSLLPALPARLRVRSRPKMHINHVCCICMWHNIIHCTNLVCTKLLSEHCCSTIQLGACFLAQYWVPATHCLRYLRCCHLWCLFYLTDKLNVDLVVHLSRYHSL